MLSKSYPNHIRMAASASDTACDEAFKAALANSNFAARRAVFNLYKPLRDRGYSRLFTLLKEQHRLDTFPLPDAASLDRIGRLATFFESTMSARARDMLRSGGQTMTDSDKTAARAAFRTAKLSIGWSEITEAPINVEDEFGRDAPHKFGSVVHRRMTDVLLEMLAAAAPLNFATTPEPEMAGGHRVFSGPTSCATWQTNQAHLEAVFAADPALREISQLTGLKPSLLYVALRSDATAVNTTTPVQYYPVTMALGNFVDGTSATERGTGLWGFLPKPFKNPHKVGSADHRVHQMRALLAHHQSFDVFYESLSEVKDGFFWEVSPGQIEWLVPRVCMRCGDFPEQQKGLGLHNSSRSRCPCRFCMVRHDDLTRARVAPSKGLTEILRLATAAGAVPPRGYVPPEGTLAQNRRERAHARATAAVHGVVAMGRPPAPMTPTARSVSAITQSVFRGGLEYLHVINGIAKRLVQAVYEEVRTARNISPLARRVECLLPYRGPASSFRRFNALVFEKLVEGKRYTDVLLVLPALTEGLLPPAKWTDVVAACLSFERLVLSLRQRAFIPPDIVRIRQFAVVFIRTLRKFPGLSGMVKPHHLMHYSETIPTAGDPRGISDAESLEAFMRRIKRLHGLTMGEGREGSMLALHALHRSVEMFNIVATARVAHGGRVNSSGALRPIIPTARPADTLVLATQVHGRSRMGGFLSPSYVAGRRGARVTGGINVKVKGDKGSAIPVGATYAAVIARELLHGMGIRADPPGTIKERATWRDNIIMASNDARWGQQPLVATDFERGGALTPGGVSAILAGGNARAHATLTLLTTADGAPDGPAISARARTAVSFETTFVQGDARHAYNQFAVGFVVAVVSVRVLPQNLGELHPGPAGAPSRRVYVVVETLKHCAPEQAALWKAHPDMRDIMEPWETAGGGGAGGGGGGAGGGGALVQRPQLLVVPADFLIRQEHFQPRGASPTQFWRFAVGGTRQTVPAVPFSRPAADGEVSDADADDDDDDDEDYDDDAEKAAGGEDESDGADEYDDDGGGDDDDHSDDAVSEDDGAGGTSDEEE